MKWIKASDRTPKKISKVIFRQISTKCILSESMARDWIEDEDLENLEWLDESDLPNESSIDEVKKDDPIINHMRNVKLLQAMYKGKKFFVECYPTDIGATNFPNTNFAVKEIELPNFDLYEEKLGYKWQKPEPLQEDGLEDNEKDKFIGEYLNKKMKNHGLPMGMEYYNKLSKHTDEAEKLWNKQLNK